MFIPERKNKLWLAIQWGILVLVAIALWAYARRSLKTLNPALASSNPCHGGF